MHGKFSAITRANSILEFDLERLECYTFIQQGIGRNGILKQFFLWEDRDLYRNIAAVAIPIALHNLFNFGVSMRDTLKLGVLRGRRILACPAGAGRLHPPQV